MNNKKRFLQGALCGALVAFIIVFAGIGVGKAVSFLYSLKTGEYSSEEKLDLIDQMIEKYYLYPEEINEKELEQGLYSGYVNALGDDYSAYYTEEEAQELLESMSGEYSGIGAVLSQDYTTYAVTINSVYKNSPAEEAGLQAGDIIYQVDDHEITDEDLNEIVTWIRGEEGTEVHIHVLRDGEKVEAVPVRRVIEVETVEYEMKANQTGYIRVIEFDTITTEQFEIALDELELQGMEGLVIDLRSNPGGSLDTVVEMLDMLLPEGVIVSMESSTEETTEYTCGGEHEFTKPLTVLVNGYSASASEIFAGAVQDHEIGEIVGTKTYGKGVVQNIMSLGDGTYLKLTVAEYFLPSGRSINKVGITPDVVIEYEYDEENPDADNQLDKALEIISQKKGN
ncbi:MAG: S41 family peptidase [Schaedlerella sp.]|nr:S41 family peptidase [Schaedlerella sp.]